MKFMLFMTLLLLFQFPLRAASPVITIDFENINPTPYFDTLAHVGSSYLAAYGVNFSPNDTGVIKGISAGGNWGMDGTVGTTFMGFNGSSWSGAHVPITLTFANPWNAFSMDIAHSNGAPTYHNLGFYESWLDVTAFLGSNQVYSGKAYLNNPNIWTTFSFGGTSFDRITWHVNDTNGGISSTYLPYGVDNITNVPEPSTFALVLSAGTILLGSRRRSSY